MSWFKNATFDELYAALGRAPANYTDNYRAAAEIKAYWQGWKDARRKPAKRKVGRNHVSNR